MLGTFTSPLNILHDGRPVPRETYIQDYCILVENFTLSCRVGLDLYCSPNIVQVIKSRRMRWTWHVARMGRKKMYRGIWWGKRGEGDQIGGTIVDGRIILKWISGSGMLGYGLDRADSRLRQVGGRL
jgi:hypothetical protein